MRRRYQLQISSPEKRGIRSWFRDRVSGLIRTTSSALGPIRSALTAPGDRPESSPILDFILSAGFAAALVLSVSPVLRHRGKPSSFIWLLGGLITLTSYSWARSGAYVKREAIERRRVSRLVPIASYYWSWKDYEPRGRFWAVAYWVLAIVTIITWLGAAE